MKSTKEQFFCLKHSSAGRPHQVYGRPEWERRFGPAEWSRNAVGLSAGRIALPVGAPRVDLTIVLPSPKIGDFVWTWYNDCIVTDGTLSLFRQAGFTGFEARPVIIEKIKRLSRKRREEVTIPPLWELLIKGKGGDADPASGIYVIDKIEDRGILLYSSFRNGIIVDETNWDGSDLFTVNGYPKYILVTDQVKELIIGRQLTNCALIPSHKLEWSSGIRPEESLAEKRAMASRPLGSLLEDLEGLDDSLDTIHALGHKGDPGAVDPLIGKFGHPNPLIWGPAASAVAKIAQHKSVSEQVREEIFSKLKGLLGHEDPLVRRTAADALGSIGGERAAEEVMKLFEDPDDLVRDKGVFVIGYLRYKPALEAVRRLTRDRSKKVRETARRVLRELNAECP
jgi:hypothetical protein